jgi:hypothetical protein
MTTEDSGATPPPASLLVGFELQERDDVLLEDGKIPLKNLRQRCGIGHIEPTAGDATQSGQMGSTAKLLTQVMGQTANIGSLRAAHPKIGEGLLVVIKAVGVDMDRRSPSPIFG